MQTATVSQLVTNFAEACRALTPSLEMAAVPWRDGEQYDNWHRIAEALFHSLVAEPCAFAAVGENGISELKMAGYGFTRSSDCNAWIAPADNLAQRFLGLATIEAPFDQVRLEGPEETRPLDGLELAFVLQAGETLRSLSVIDLHAL